MFSIFKRKKKFRQLPQTTISQSTGVNNSYVGRSVALSLDGTTAIVGAANGNPGSATVFTRSGMVWTEQQILTMSGGSGDDNFGYSVALSADGNTAIIGAPGDDVGALTDQGSVLVFTRSYGTWTLQQQFWSNTPQTPSNFGNSVALSSDGNTALIGAYTEKVGANNYQGAAYVFTRSGVTWSQQAKLTQSNGGTSDNFGQAVALSSDGNTALIGAPGDTIAPNNFQGSATVFTRSSGTWTQQTILTQSNGASYDFFGQSVALSSDGNTAIIGTTGDDIGVNTDQGSVTVFTRSSTTWTQQQILTQSTGAAYDSFGQSVALSGSGNIAIVGVSSASSNTGLAIIFIRSNNGWTQEQILTQTGGSSSDFFGWSVALSRNGLVAIVGALFGTFGANTNQGNATVFYRR